MTDRQLSLRSDAALEAWPRPYELTGLYDARPVADLIAV